MTQLKLRKRLKAFFQEQNLLFLIILFLPTQLGKHYFLDFSNIYSLKIDYLALVIYFWDLLVVFFICQLYVTRFNFKRTPLLLLGIFLLSQMLSLIFSTNSGAGWVRLEQYFIGGLFGVYLASEKFERVKKSILWGLLFGIFFEGILAIFQFVLGSSTGLWILGERTFDVGTPLIATFNWYGQIFLRPYGTFSHPNVLSAFLVISLLIVFYISGNSFITGQAKHWRILGINLALGFFATILTFSRAAFAVLFIESLFLLRKKMKYFLLILLVLLPFVFVRFDSAFNFDSLSISRREELAVIAVNQFLSNPLFGVGLNNFIGTTATSSLVSGPNRFLQPVHNIFLLTLSETGIAGSVGFGILLGYPIYKLFKLRKKAHERMFLSLFGIVFFLGMFDHYFLTIAQGQRLLFLIWGLSMQTKEA